MNNKPVDVSTKTKITVSIFFLIHYGIFHLAYAFVIVGFGIFVIKPSLIQLLFMILAITVFFINHGFSYYHNHRQDLERKPNIGSLMIMPYARIIPMHFTILFGGFFFMFGSFIYLFASFVIGEALAGYLKFLGITLVLVFFLLLKTLADLLMHVLEHNPELLKKNK